MAIEITFVEKSHGPLTKRISLCDGKVESDGSACTMSSGMAQRLVLDGVADLATTIAAMQSNEALALGALRPDLPDVVEIVTKDKINGIEQPHVIARTASSIVYSPQQRAFALLDFDQKGMPREVAARLDELGGFEQAIASIVPEIASTARLSRASTSTGIYNAETGQKVSASGGMHFYVLVIDGTDIDRFLRVLHDRCWLVGLGWYIVGAAGQLLERSIVDRMVGAPERLVFEGPPVVEPPLAQDVKARRPVAIDGEPLDTLSVMPPLTIVECARLDELRSREAQRLAPEVAKSRDEFIQRQARRLAERSGLSSEQAARIVEQQTHGVLLPDVELPFDDPDLAGKTVADVLADPAQFEGETLADPLEGIDYGRGKAKILRRADGTPWINSFAHGRTVYELRYDARAVEMEMTKASVEEVARVFVRYALLAQMDAADIERLRDLAHQRSRLGKRTIDRMLKTARTEQRKQRVEEERQRRAAERRDPRPQLPAPPADAPWLTVIGPINEILGAATDLEPPARDIEDVMVQLRVRRVPNMHALTALGANAEEDDEKRLPPPEQPLLTRLDDMQLAELIERYIDYVDEFGRSVHLSTGFVRHFRVRYNDRALPCMAAIATLPLVLGDGTLLAGRGLDRERGVLFRIPNELLSILPRREDCDAAVVAEAMRFLTDEWLCDVATDYAGKCILIALALSVIERSLLPDRPTFWVVAGRRGGGKTTTIIMLLMAVTGIRPAAAAWSPNEEERRKALLAYLLEALPAIVWDNIPRGSEISCPHIEKACTTAMYSDRKLGVSQTVATSAATVQIFTGNNVGPRGDLTSRSLMSRIEIDRVDPENRPFTHPDPIAWTEANRGKILAALYKILLGNPLLGTKPKELKTRFKAWWQLIGSAVEHAAKQAVEYDRAKSGEDDAKQSNVKAVEVDFRNLFLQQEENDEEAATLAEALMMLANRWPNSDRFKAADVADQINDLLADADAPKSIMAVRWYLFPKTKTEVKISAEAISKRLRNRVGNPVRYGEKTLILRSDRDSHTKLRQFHVEVREPGS